MLLQWTQERELGSPTAEALCSLCPVAGMLQLQGGDGVKLRVGGQVSGFYNPSQLVAEQGVKAGGDQGHWIGPEFGIPGGSFAKEEGGDACPTLNGRNGSAYKHSVEGVHV